MVLPALSFFAVDALIRNSVARECSSENRDINLFRIAVADMRATNTSVVEVGTHYQRLITGKT